MQISRLTRLRAVLRDPKRWKRWGFEALLALAVIVAVTLWQNRDLPEGPAPAIAGLLSDGTPIKLGVGETAPDHRSRLVVFWATWCPVCRAEAGNIESIARDWPVISIAMQSGDRAEVARYLDEHFSRIPALVDSDGENARAWGVRAVPAHFILDRTGTIRFRVVGYSTTLGLRLRLWLADWLFV